MFSARFHVPAVASLLLCAAAAEAQSPDFVDVAYASPNSAWKLDLYLPDAGCKPFPLVVFIHGGGWISGDKADVDRFVPYLLKSGFAVASINYRLCFVHKWPSQMHDCKAAIRFVRANAKSWGIDPDRIGAFGESAGGQLAAVLGTSAGIESLEGDVGEFLGVSSAVQAVADYYAPTDLYAFALFQGPDNLPSKLIGVDILDVMEGIDNPDNAQWIALIDSSIPMTHITDDDPPFYIMHGDADSIVPFEHSQWLHLALTKRGVPSTFDLLPGLGHTDIPDAQTEQVVAFFQQSLGAAGPVVGDLDHDCIVGQADVAALLAQWGKCPSPEEATCDGDIAPPGGDGVVAAADIAALLANWTGPR